MEGRKGEGGGRGIMDSKVMDPCSQFVSRATVAISRSRPVDVHHAGKCFHKRSQICVFLTKATNT